jgi:hypothetical protein
MNNEPVAIRYDFDGYGYQYIDSGSGSDWQTRVQGEPLYTSLHLEQYPQIAISPEIVGYVAPQRTWVGLTDEDIWEAYMESPVELDCSTDKLYALSRTVEAKLKQKNGYAEDKNTLLKNNRRK